MRLEFHGAARTVTGSRHILSVNGSRILLDCGLFQGRRSEADHLNRDFGFDPRGIDAVGCVAQRTIRASMPRRASAPPSAVSTSLK